MLGKRAKRYNDFRQKAEEVKSRQTETRTPEQKENAENRNNRSVTPPHEALPPTKFGTLFRPRQKRAVFADLSKTPKEKKANNENPSYVTPAVKEQEEVVLSSDRLLNTPEGDLNSSAWAMMGDSEDFEWQGTGSPDDDGLALMNESILSSNTSRDENLVISRTPTSRDATDNNLPRSLDETRPEKSDRLVRSSRARKKESSPTVEVPGKGSPFDIFRQNSTHIALDETSAYAARIEELEAALEAERAHRQAVESKSTETCQTPATFRVLSHSSSTPSSVASSSLDPDSLYARNQTLVKEVRFAEQTCIEVSDKNRNLEKQLADTKMQLQTLREENQALHHRAARLDEEKSAAASLENSWKARVSEVEGLLQATEEEKTKALEQSSNWESRYTEAMQQMARDTENASDREGKLIRAVLQQESLSKELREAKENQKSLQERLSQANRIEQELRDQLSGSNQESGESDQEEIALIREENDRLVLQLQNSEHEIQKHTGTIQNLQSTIVEITEKLSEESAVRIDLVKKLDEERDELSKVSLECEMLHQNLERAMRKDEVQQENIKTLSQKLEATLLEMDTLQLELNTAKRLSDEANEKGKTQADAMLSISCTDAGDSFTGVPQGSTALDLDNNSTSPARTVHLELMEEARQDFPIDNDEGPMKEMIVDGGMSSDNNVSESLSTIAGLSHLFTDEGSNAVPESPPSRKRECSTDEEFDMETEEDGFMLETNNPNLEDTVSSLSIRLRETELERDLLKESLEYSRKSVCDGQEPTRKENQAETISELAQRPEPCAGDNTAEKETVERLQSDVFALNEKIQTLSAELLNARNQMAILQKHTEDKDQQIRNAEARLQASLTENEKHSAELERVKAAFNDQVDVASSKMGKMEEELASLLTRNSELANEKEEATRTLQEAQKSLREIEHELEDARKGQVSRTDFLSRESELLEIEEDLRARLEAAEERKTMDATKISSLSTAKNELRVELEQIQREKQLLTNQLDGKQNALEQLQDQLDCLLQRNASLESEKHRLDAELQGEMLQRKSSSQNHDDIIGSLKKAVDEGAAAMESSERRRRATEELAEHSEKRLYELQGEHTAVKSELEEKVGIIASLKNELSIARRQLSDLRKTVQSDRYHLEQAQKDLKRLDSVVSSLEADKTALTSECQSLRSGLEIAENKLSETEMITSKLAALNDELQSKNQSLAEMTRVVEATEQLAHSTEGRYMEVRATLSSLETERLSLLKELATKESLLSSANANLEKTTKDLEEMRSEKLAMMDSVKAGVEAVSLKQSLAVSEDACRGLEGQLTQLKDALFERETDLSRSLDRIHSLENKCKGLRRYTRKVARKCDDWEVYFENWTAERYL